MTLSNPDASHRIPTGVLTVLATPFCDDGSLDHESLGRLVEHQITWGVDGVVCFGLAGEGYKLTDEERRSALRCVIEAAAGAVPVIAGVEHNGLEGAVARADQAAECGVAAIMAYPPSFVKPDRDGLIEYYSALSSCGLPVIVQDAPAWTVVPLPVELLAAIAAHAPLASYVKVEAPPTAPKIASIIDAGLIPVGGYGAVYLLEELRAGIVATMPGCGMPGMYTDICRAHREGRVDDAWHGFTTALPLLVFQMSSLDVFVAAQKAMLVRAGVIASTRRRQPASAVGPAQIDWLWDVIRREGLDRYVSEGP